MGPPVSLNQRPLSSAFLHQELLLRPIHSNYRTWEGFVGRRNKTRHYRHALLDLREKAMNPKRIRYFVLACLIVGFVLVPLGYCAVATASIDMLPPGRVTRPSEYSEAGNNRFDFASRTIHGLFRFVLAP